MIYRQRSVRTGPGNGTVWGWIWSGKGFLNVQFLKIFPTKCDLFLYRTPTVPDSIFANCFAFVYCAIITGFMLGIFVLNCGFFSVLLCDRVTFVVSNDDVDAGVFLAVGDGAIISEILGEFPFIASPASASPCSTPHRWWCRAWRGCANGIWVDPSVSWRSSGRRSWKPVWTAPFPVIRISTSTCCTPPVPSSSCTAGTSSWGCSPHPLTGIRNPVCHPCEGTRSLMSSRPTAGQRCLWEVIVHELQIENIWNAFFEDKRGSYYRSG